MEEIHIFKYALLLKTFKGVYHTYLHMQITDHICECVWFFVKDDRRNSQQHNNRVHLCQQLR
jgi:hypothetical protein